MDAKGRPLERLPLGRPFVEKAGRSSSKERTLTADCPSSNLIHSSPSISVSLGQFCLVALLFGPFRLDPPTDRSAPRHHWQGTHPPDMELLLFLDTEDHSLPCSRLLLPVYGNTASHSPTDHSKPATAPPNLVTVTALHCCRSTLIYTPMTNQLPPGPLFSQTSHPLLPRDCP